MKFLYKVLICVFSVSISFSGAYGMSDFLKYFNPHRIDFPELVKDGFSIVKKDEESIMTIKAKVLSSIDTVLTQAEKTFLTKCCGKYHMYPDVVEFIECIYRWNCMNGMCKIFNSICSNNLLNEIQLKFLDHVERPGYLDGDYLFRQWIMETASRIHLLNNCVKLFQVVKRAEFEKFANLIILDHLKNAVNAASLESWTISNCCGLYNSFNNEKDLQDPFFRDFVTFLYVNLKKLNDLGVVF